jgi:hypothetical protein
MGRPPKQWPDSIGGGVAKADPLITDISITHVSRTAFFIWFLLFSF